MANANVIAPTYSHGGTTRDGQLPAVPGTGVSNGRPIWIDGAMQDASMWVFLKSNTGATGTAVVYIEGAGGQVNPQVGQPPADEWVDCSDANGYTLYLPAVPASNHFSKLVKCLTPNIPMWRTRIASIDDGLYIVSYIPAVRLGSVWVQAAYPPYVSAAPNLTSPT